MDFSWIDWIMDWIIIRIFPGLLDDPPDLSPFLAPFLTPKAPTNCAMHRPGIGLLENPRAGSPLGIPPWNAELEHMDGTWVNMIYPKNPYKTYEKVG